MKPVAYISDGGVIFKESPPDSILKLSPLYTSAEIQELHNLVKEQQEKIDRLLDQYQRLNENLEMWKTGHFKQQAEIEVLKLRELTDREIMELYCVTSDNDPLEFARAILRKASEK